MEINLIRSTDLGSQALNYYVDKERVDVCQALIGDIIDQILINTEKNDIPEQESHELVIAGIIKMIRQEAERNGYHSLSYELKDIE